MGLGFTLQAEDSADSKQDCSNEFPDECHIVTVVLRPPVRGSR